MKEKGQRHSSRGSGGRPGGGEHGGQGAAEQWDEHRKTSLRPIQEAFGGLAKEGLS